MGDDILCEDVKCSQMKGGPPPSPKSHPQLFIPLALPYRSGLSWFGFVVGSKQALLLGLFLVLPSQRTSKCKSHHSPLSVTRFTLPLILQQLIQTPPPPSLTFHHRFAPLFAAPPLPPTPPTSSFPATPNILNRSPRFVVRVAACYTAPAWKNLIGFRARRRRKLKAGQG